MSEQEESITTQSQHITKMEEAVEHAEWDVNNYISAQQARWSKAHVINSINTNSINFSMQYHIALKN